MHRDINPNISDEALLALLQDSTTAEEAFAILLDRYSLKLYTVIRRIVITHEDADDVLQNTFIKVWKSIKNFRGEAKLFTWMYSIATNEALSHIRRERNMGKIPLETNEYDLSQTLSGDPFFDGDEAEAALYSAVNQLPEKQQNVFRMRYFDDLPYKDISEITGTSIGALKANFHHAIKKLQKYLHIDS